MEPEASLFHFEWGVDQHGYELVYRESVSRETTRTIEGWYVQRNGGPLRAYRPLDEHRGLFRRFAHLPPEKESVLDFITEFGFLFPHNQDSELVNDWIARARGMGEIVRRIDEGNAGGVRRFFNDEISPAAGPGNFEPVIPVFGLRRHLPRFFVRIVTDPRARPTLRVVPESLIGAMWLQVAGEITEGTNFKKCRYCPNWFPVGPRAGRKTKVFCSDRCRVAWNWRKSKERRK